MGFSFNDWEANLSRVTELMKSEMVLTPQNTWVSHLIGSIESQTVMPIRAPLAMISLEKKWAIGLSIVAEKTLKKV